MQIIASLKTCNCYTSFESHNKPLYPSDSCGTLLCMSTEDSPPLTFNENSHLDMGIIFIINIGMYLSFKCLLSSISHLSSGQLNLICLIL